ncbi:hypothetical protein CF327_g6336 [Tilletia walkeri]|nr:hypothetical protein CF327_g6336 [Tilletia walkeri]
MLLEGAISPQGWSLSALKVLEAAVLSASEWQSAERNCNDQVQIRARAIGHVRRLAQSSSTYLGFQRVKLNGKASSDGDDTPEEVALICSMIEHWTEDNELQAHISWRSEEKVQDSSAQPEGEAVPKSSGALRSSRRPASSGSEDVDRIVKKPRIDDSQASTSSTSLIRRPPVTGQDTAFKSATRRFFETHELLSLLLDILDFEKVDLVILSTVSKQMRAMVLPRLVRSVSLPINKALDFQKLLQANPGLVEAIRHLRVWDPVAIYYARDKKSIPTAFHNDTPPKSDRNQWVHFGDLLLLVQQRETKQIPFVDLSFGQIDNQLYSQLKRAPRLMERLSALRIVGDYHNSRYSGILDSQSAFVRHGEAMSEELSDILHLALDVQDSVGSDTFQVFHFEGLRTKAAGRDSVLPAWDPD